MIIINNQETVGAFFEFTLHGGRVLVNKVTGNFQALFGYSHAQWLNSSILFSSRIHPHDQDIARNLFQPFPQPRQKLINFRFRKADGQIVCVQGHFVKFRKERSCEIILRLDIQDARRIAEPVNESVLLTNYSAMLENSDDYIYFKDRNHVFTGASQTLVSITDPVEHWTELLGQTDYDVFPESYADNYYRLEKQVFSGQVEVAHEVQQTLTKDGKRGWVDNRKYPIKDQAGKIIGLFGIARDITENRLMEEALKQSERRFHELFEYSPDPCMILVNKQFIDCNAAAVHALGFKEKAELLRLHPGDISPKKQSDGRLSAEKANAMITIAETTGCHRFEWEHKRKNGETFPVEVTLGRIILAGETALYVDWRDISARKQAEDSLRLTAKVYTNLMEGILITDTAGIILDVNPAFTRLTGYSREEVVGKNPRILKSERQEKHFYQLMWQTLINDGQWQGELWNRKKNGDCYAENLNISAIYDTHGQVTHYVGIFSDITQKLQYQQELEKVAHFDSLTGLPNRVLLADRLQQALMHHKRTGKTLAIGYLDLDGFKPVNDQLGHLAGDELLKEVGKRMAHVLRADDTIARIGGDEFVLLLGDLDNNDESDDLFQRLIEQIAAPFQMDEAVVKVTASIGVTFYPGDIGDADLLLRHADQAMYVAKNSGKGCIHSYDPLVDIRKKAGNELIQQLRTALSSDQFVLFYQPQVDCRQGRVVGMEALIRWQHPVLGIRLPGEFLPLIEKHPLIIELGEWVIYEALTQLCQWHERGYDLTIAVNIAAKQILQKGFFQRLQFLLKPFPEKIKAKLKIEITETAALDDLGGVCLLIEQCRKLGIDFSLDDFGTGYSTLIQLKRIATKQIKIDRSFINDILHDPGDLAIVKGIISLAQAFRLHVVAEGVEKVEQVLLLQKLGCDVIQGYVLARPMPEQLATEWLQSFTPDPRWQFNRDEVFNQLGFELTRIEAMHRIWLTEVHNGCSQILSYNDCRLTQWITEFKEQSQQWCKEFDHIMVLHQQVHELAVQINSMPVALSRNKLQSMLDQASEQLLSAIGAVRQKYGLGDAVINQLENSKG